MRRVLPKKLYQMNNLAKKKCIPCEKKDTKPLPPEKIDKLMREISSPSGEAGGWSLVSDSATVVKKLTREFNFKDFVRALDFVNQVADIAEMEGHHPDIYISYNKVRLELWTHSIENLTENDFILAAKINMLRF